MLFRSRHSIEEATNKKS